ncbi:MAG TPA: WD40 repeat domain-containing protein [Anaerolineaceae bacterium]|nr:WD40 repeat domain-containing protein [Anaerolineaceae bacterium]
MSKHGFACSLFFLALLASCGPVQPAPGVTPGPFPSATPTSAIASQAPSPARTSSPEMSPTVQTAQAYCDQLAQRYQPPAGFTTFCDDQFSFAFDVPADWQSIVLASAPDRTAPLNKVRMARRFYNQDSSNSVRFDTYRLPPGDATLAGMAEGFFSYPERENPGREYPALRIGGQPAYAILNRWHQDISAVYLFFRHGEYYTVMEIKAPDLPGLELNWNIARSLQVPGASPGDNRIPDELIADSRKLVEPAPPAPAATPLPPAGLVPPGARARLGKGGMRHLALTMDGKQVAIASEGIVCLYHLEPFQEAWCSLTGSSPMSILQTISFDPQGTRIAAGLLNGSIVLWDTATGQRDVVRFTHLEVVYSLAWSPDGSRIAFSANDDLIRIWDPLSGKQLQILRGSGPAVLSLAWSPDGSRIAAGDYWGDVSVFDVGSGEHLYTWKGDQGYTIYSVSWSPDSTRVIAGSGYVSCAENCTPTFDGLVTILDGQTGKKLVQVGAGNQVSSLSVSPDGSLVAVGLDDNTLRLYRLTNGALLQKIISAGKAGVFWLPGGQHLLATDGNNHLLILDAATGAHSEILVEGFDQLLAPVWSPDGSKLAASTENGAIFIWDAATATLANIIADARSERRLAWSPDAKQIASIRDREVRFWDTSSDKRLRTLPTAGVTLMDLGWSPDGHQFAALDYRGLVTLWDAQSWTQLKTVQTIANPYTDEMVWSRDSKTLATSGNGIFLWDPATGQQTGKLGDETETHTIAWSADGSKFVAANGNRAMIWNAATLVPLLQPGDDPTWAAGSAALSPDGKILATGASLVTLRDASTGGTILTLDGHSQGVYWLDFSPDGKTLASWSTDGTVVLWNVPAFRAVPVAPTPTPDPIWNTYLSTYFQISLKFPKAWQEDPSGNGIFRGPDGYFQIAASGSAPPDPMKACELELRDNAREQRYGMAPTLEALTIDHQPACLILPSADQPESHKGIALLVILYPDPRENRVLLQLWADKAHIRELAGCLKFLR